MILLFSILAARAQDLTLDEALASGSSATEVRGGTFTGSGWRVDNSGDGLFWDLGTQVDRGTVSFTLDAVTLANLTGDNNHIVELFDAGDHWSCSRAINVRVYGSDNPADHGDIKLKVWEPGGYAEARGGIQVWDGLPHSFTVSWDADHAALYRDGVELVWLDTTGLDLRMGTLWLPLASWGSGYSAPLGSVYRDLHLEAWEPAGDGGSGDGGSGDGGDDGDPSTFGPIEDVGLISSGGSDIEDLPVQGAGGSPSEVSYLMFDLSSLSGDVVSASLRLQVRADGSAGGSSGQVYAVADTSWTEEGLSWGSRPATGALLASYPGPAAGDVVLVDVAAGVLAGGRVAFALQGTGDDGVHFASKEEGDGSNAAILTVVTTPSTGDGGSADGGSADGGSADGGTPGDGGAGGDGGAVPDGGAGGDGGGDGLSPTGDFEGNCACGGGAAPGALSLLLLPLVAGRRRRTG